MTYYHNEIRRLNDRLYARSDVTARIVRAKRHIDRHYASALDLDEICRQAHFSKYHFIRLFRRHYGRTPHQYLTEVRVARAKALIRSGMTVRAACFSVGYDSTTSFSALFRKVTGSSPSQVAQSAIFDTRAVAERGNL